MLGFHNYKPVDGLYWEYSYQEYTKLLEGVNTIKLYKCSRCGKVHAEVIEFYTKPEVFSLGFNVDKVVKVLEARGIKHINEFYAK